MPEARVFRRAGRGKSASPVRRGESEARPRLSLTLLLYRLRCAFRAATVRERLPAIERGCFLTNPKNPTLPARTAVLQ